jgi:hypothetical protein
MAAVRRTKRAAACSAAGVLLTGSTGGADPHVGRNTRHPRLPPSETMRRLHAGVTAELHQSPWRLLRVAAILRCRGARSPSSPRPAPLRKAEELGWSVKQLRHELRASMKERCVKDDRQIQPGSDERRFRQSTIRLSIRVSPNQLEDCRAAARRAGLCVDEWVVLALVQAARRALVSLSELHVHMLRRSGMASQPAVLPARWEAGQAPRVKVERALPAASRHRP